ALYMHNQMTIPLGLVGTHLWPFKGAIDYITNELNNDDISKIVETWLSAKVAYSTKNKESKMYYLANASGSPPQEAVKLHSWPKSESISDSKTSAGMDRTDDIKKGIYQVLKIGTEIKGNHNIKTAIVSNLPAYRHGDDYVLPFENMLWGTETDVVALEGFTGIKRADLRNVFDYLITLENPVLRDLVL
ncbi:MAG: hypothetical protein OEL57_15285, partial [Trichlorobacter sp.]|uniref:hypothetical protein n=1 Tax=Trichlorobacter sp. TaxID=2911007 RepID=UPI0025624A14